MTNTTKIFTNAHVIVPTLSVNEMNIIVHLTVDSAKMFEAVTMFFVLVMKCPSQKIVLELKLSYGDENDLINPLKQEIVEEDSSIQELPNSWASHGNYRLVGNGKITNRYCGKFARFKGCLRVDLHNKTTLDGVNYAGKVFVRRVHYSCGKPSCPICYKSGWAVREAENIKHRLVEACLLYTSDAADE